MSFLTKLSIYFYQFRLYFLFYSKNYASVIIIIYFVVQSVPDLASGSPFQLAVVTSKKCIIL